MGVDVAGGQGNLVTIYRDRASWRSATGVGNAEVTAVVVAKGGGEDSVVVLLMVEGVRQWLTVGWDFTGGLVDVIVDCEILRLIFTPELDVVGGILGTSVVIDGSHEIISGWGCA